MVMENPTYPTSQETELAQYQAVLRGEEATAVEPELAEYLGLCEHLPADFFTPACDLPPSAWAAACRRIDDRPFSLDYDPTCYRLPTGASKTTHSRTTRTLDAAPAMSC